MSSRPDFDPAARGALLVSRILAALWLAGLAVRPWTMLDRLPVRCLFHPLLGRPCPGCGITHSVWLLLHGQPAAAFEWNPLGLLVLPLAVLFVAFGLPRRPFPPAALDSRLRKDDL